MNEKTRRQLLLLIALVVILVGAIGFQLWGRGGSPAAAPSAASNPVSRPEAQDQGNQGTGAVTDVRLDLLERHRATYQAPERNPFRFKPRPAPVARREPAPSGPVFTPAVPPPSGPPPPKPIRVKFIGLALGPRGQLVAVLRDEDTGAVVHRSAGDIIEGRYRLLSVTPERIEVAYLDNSGRRVIPLSGQ